ncbi:LPXTG-motif cell wall anchor domain protein [Gleimia coleocanis DSM 15436]|uniref:LPXTG-motif cell wall anchor domain protein n=1 Tax=Gleimia coleocanis DSM 15436 TaxID=525245 RepID=C0VYH0_9ACTO|nr:5'-nucleotidase C-terminal domain-containing protein [Gleimia coleocanis]EEH64473.1 LPXTG-motif cell wall anchor domain protein [Gleimia coleocanis DSM 15436]
MKKNFMRSAVSVAATAAVVVAPGVAFATEATPTAPDTSAAAPVASTEATAPATGAPETAAPTTGDEAAAPAPTTGSTEAAPAATTTPASPAPAAPAAANVVTLDLYKLTDIHGHIEKVEKKGKVTEAGLAAVQCYLDKAQAENPNFSFTLLGDNIGASPFTSGSQKDNPTIAALNKLPVLASTIGNHELDMGQEVFKQRIDGTNTAEFVKVGFPYLGANVDGMGTYVAGSETLPYLGDYVVKELGGVKVAYIGAIAEDVPFKLSPDATKGLTFNNPIAKIGELAKKLKAEGKADLVVAMLDDDVKNNYPLMPAEVDVIMGGDTHVPYEFDKENSKEMLESANPKLAGIASGSYTDNLGLVKIKYNLDTKKVESADSILISATDVVAGASADCLMNSTAGAEVAKAVESAKEAGKAVIVSGVTGEWKRGVFVKPGEEKPGAGSNRGIESTLGNLVADSILDQVTVDGKTPVDIGVVNAGGLRADLVPNNGVLTYADTFASLPFSNELGYAPMTGAEFKMALENQWKTDLNSQNSRPMLRLGTSSNLTYTYDATKPAGERITSVLLNGKPLEMDKTYNVGSMTFVLAGGDGYFAKGLKVKTFGVLDRDGFNTYLKKVTGPALKASNLKRGIGLTLPAAKVAKDAKFELPLRGLSFSEGPGKTENVKVTVGAQTVTVPVTNDLVEPNANNENSVVTTDGYGTATAMLDAAMICEGMHGMQELAVTVSTDFGMVVSEGNAQKVTVDCGEAPAPAAVALKRNTVVAGGVVTGEGTGFTPGAKVMVELHSKPVLLGTVVATADGKVPFNFKIPANVTPGKHHIVLTEVGTNKVAKAEIEVKAAMKAKKLANTGATSGALSLLALSLALFGGVLVAARKRA